MTGGVVDLFEVVEIHEEHRVGMRLHHFERVGAAMELGPVRKTDEPVVGGLVLQRSARGGFGEQDPAADLRDESQRTD